MTDYARIVDDVVIELFTPPDGLTLDDCFHADFVAQFVEVPDGSSPGPGWRYADGAFSAPAPPPPRWDQVLAEKIAAGIAITSTGTPGLNATYALDPVTMEQVGSVARDAAAGLGLPGNGAEFVYPDAAGTPHDFSEAQIIALYKAMRDLLLQLNTQAAMLKAGAVPTWPTQAATIS